jgi:hypothetical protein
LKHSTPSSNSPVEIIITQAILSEIKGEIREHGPTQAAIVVLDKHLGDKIAAAKANPAMVKERGTSIYPTLPTSIGDPYLLERVLCKAVEAIAHIDPTVNFRLTFPYIDNLIRG